MHKMFSVCGLLKQLYAIANGRQLRVAKGNTHTLAHTLLHIRTLIYSLCNSL